MLLFDSREGPARRVSPAPERTAGMPEVNRCSEITDTCEQFQTLISYLGARVPL